MVKWRFWERQSEHPPCVGVALRGRENPAWDWEQRLAFALALVLGEVSSNGRAYPDYDQMLTDWCAYRDSLRPPDELARLQEGRKRIAMLVIDQTYDQAMANAWLRAQASAHQDSSSKE